MATAIPAAAIAAPTNKQEADFSQRPGGAAGARGAHKAGAGGPKGPLPPLWFCGPGGRRPPGPQNAAAPPGPLRSPGPSRSSINHHTPNGRPSRRPWKSAPFSLRIPGEAHALPLRNFSGVWGRSRPQPGSRGAAVPGHAEAIPQSISYLIPTGTYAYARACIQKGVLFCGENNSY